MRYCFDSVIVCVFVLSAGNRVFDLRFGSKVIRCGLYCIFDKEEGVIKRVCSCNELLYIYKIPHLIM